MNEEISFATDYGTIALTSTGSPMDANDNITPTVFEEAEYGAGTGYLDTSGLAGNGAMLIRYGNTFMGHTVHALLNKNLMVQRSTHLVFTCDFL